MWLKELKEMDASLLKQYKAVKENRMKPGGQWFYSLETSLANCHDCVLSMIHEIEQIEREND